MTKVKIELKQMKNNERNQFILDNQRAFKFGAIEEFGKRDDHFEEDEEIISRKTIEECIDAEGAKTYCIWQDGKIIGGVILKINEITKHNELQILFVNPEEHSKGIGYATWCEVEKLYPETIVWETCTPYFETRNIHFYINKCGFQAIKFYNKYFKDPNITEDELDDEDDMMFEFEKVMRKEEYDKY